MKLITVILWNMYLWLVVLSFCRLQFASRIQAFLPTIAYSCYEWQRAWDKPILDCVDHIIEKINVHAHTEGKLQVELAALMYMETRLAREHGQDGCYTFGADGEAEVVNAQGGRPPELEEVFHLGVTIVTLYPLGLGLWEQGIRISHGCTHNPIEDISLHESKVWSYFSGASHCGIRIWDLHLSNP
ncbi:hypothetical protein SO802_001109 [Lithocarpus litseifolius]|uniref:Uncharacterized protein n=1 Tax=Lithocarpus litseifolius TaxID=425828 RepID=A0AAW2DTF6_9ROSI